MAWLGDWAKRVKLTIDHGDIDAEQTWHHLRVHLSASSGHSSRDVSCVFDELESNDNRKKIALTKADGTTQLYCEIEKWDHASEQAELWVSRDGWVWSPDVDTDLYLYYDKNQDDNTTYVGDKGLAGRDGPRENVWDTGFKMVQHANDETTSTITDSTGNSNDGTKKGANEPIEADGKIGKAQNFDGSDDYVDFGDDASLRNHTARSAFVWLAPTAFTGTYRYVYDAGWMASPYGVMVRLHGVSNTIRIYLRNTLGVSVQVEFSYTPDDWMRIGYSWDGTTVRWFKNGAEVSSVAFSGTLACSDRNLTFGKAGDGYQSYGGLSDEFRISNIARTGAWIKASYESERDHLLDFGSEELPAVGLENKSANMAVKMIAAGLL